MSYSQTTTMPVSLCTDPDGHEPHICDPSTPDIHFCVGKGEQAADLRRMGVDSTYMDLIARKAYAAMVDQDFKRGT